MEDEDLPAGAAGGDEAALHGDLPGGAAGGRDAAEAAFERGAAERAGSRQDRREDARFGRVLRDRAILSQQVAELQAQLAAERAARAKMHADGLGTELDQAERAAREAAEAGDAEAAARANRRVAELAAARTAATIEARGAEREAAEVKARRPAPVDPGPTDTTAAWLQENGWYGRDQRMTRQAQALHAEAVEDEGLQPDSAGYWAFIERGLEARFPGKVKALYAQQPARQGASSREEGEVGEREADPAAAARIPPRGVSGAAPAARSAGGAPAPAGQSIRLSADAVAMAKQLGITPQQYAVRAAELAKRGAINIKNVTGA